MRGILEGETVAIGAVGEALIAHTHGPAFVDDPDTRLSRIESNPSQAAVIEAARSAGLLFIKNVVLDDNQRFLRIAAGHPELAFQELVTFARSIYEVPVPNQFDVVIGGVGYPKDSNLYQASRAASYLYFAPFPVVRPGGFIIIPTRCEEGAREGVGEQRFLAAMRDAPSFQNILGDARLHCHLPGQQRAFVMAKVLENAHFVIVGSKYPDLVSDCEMIPAATIEQALQMTGDELGSSCNVSIVPHTMLKIPVMQPL